MKHGNNIIESRLNWVNSRQLFLLINITGFLTFLFLFVSPENNINDIIILLTVALSIDFFVLNRLSKISFYDDRIDQIFIFRKFYTNNYKKSIFWKNITSIEYVSSKGGTMTNHCKLQLQGKYWKLYFPCNQEDYLALKDLAQVKQIRIILKKYG